MVPKVAGCSPPRELEDGHSALRGVASKSAAMGLPWLCYCREGKVFQNLPGGHYGSPEGWGAWESLCRPPYSFKLLLKAKQKNQKNLPLPVSNKNRKCFPPFINSLKVDRPIEEVSGFLDPLESHKDPQVSFEKPSLPSSSVIMAIPWLLPCPHPCRDLHAKSYLDFHNQCLNIYNSCVRVRSRARVSCWNSSVCFFDPSSAVMSPCLSYPGHGILSWQCCTTEGGDGCQHFPKVTWNLTRLCEISQGFAQNIGQSQPG